jgi:hypothetical protein
MRGGNLPDNLNKGLGDLLGDKKKIKNKKGENDGKDCGC